MNRIKGLVVFSIISLLLLSGCNDSKEKSPKFKPVLASTKISASAVVNSVTQYTCTDSECSKCKKYVYPQNTCQKTSSVSSLKASCEVESINFKIYQSSDCQGFNNKSQLPIGVCSPNGNGTYIMNRCGG